MQLPQQLSAFLLSAFGVLALALAAIGLCGAVSHGVSQRTQEIDIRMVLGADRARVMLVAGDLRLVVGGGALGLALALAAARLLGGLLFEVDPLDPLTFVGVPLLLLAAAALLATCSRPAAPAGSIPSPHSEPTAASQRAPRPGSSQPRSRPLSSAQPNLRFGLAHKSGHADSCPSTMAVPVEAVITCDSHRGRVLAPHSPPHPEPDCLGPRRSSPERSGTWGLRLAWIPRGPTSRPRSP